METVRATTQYWMQKQNAGPSSGSDPSNEYSSNFLQTATTKESLNEGPQNTNEKMIVGIKQEEQPVLDEHGNQGHEGHENAPEPQCSNHPQFTVEYRESRSDTAGMPGTHSKLNETNSGDNNTTELGDSQSKVLNSVNSLSDEIFRFIEPNSQERPGL